MRFKNSTFEQVIIIHFKTLIKKAKEYKIEIAMDYALQAAPDHPWVKEHPDWFKWRPDGTVQYAENPPKKIRYMLELSEEQHYILKLKAVKPI